MQIQPCEKCNGTGCENCKFMGYLGKEGSSTYYLKLDDNNNPIKGDLKSSGGTGYGFVDLIFKLMQEPHDFIWAGKRKKKPGQ